MKKTPRYHYMDSHVHTNLSHDGKSSIAEYLEYAKERSVDEVTYTEHYDVYDGVDSKLTTLDVMRYWREFLSETMRFETRTNFGIEIGLRPECEYKIKQMTDSYRFDFIIGSSHITRGKDMSMDPSFFAGLTMQEAYGEYFKEVRENIDIFDDFDVYGHLDYVVRYGGYGCKMIKYQDFVKILDSILEALIKKGKGLELNTSGYRYGLSCAHPNAEILQRYYDKGGRIITVGSDAHESKYLASHFDDAYDLLEKIGFKEIAVFHHREPTFHEIATLKNHA